MQVHQHVHRAELELQTVAGLWRCCSWPYGSALISAVTIASTDCQNALALLVGCMGCLGIEEVMPLVARLTYRPDVEKFTVEDPRAEATRIVSFAC